MIDPDDQIRRLWQAGRPAEPEAAGDVPFGLATRVLAARLQPSADDDALFRVCRSAVLWSGALAVLAVGFSLANTQALHDFTDWRAADLRLAGALAQQSLP